MNIVANQLASIFANKKAIMIGFFCTIREAELARNTEQERREGASSTNK